MVTLVKKESPAESNLNVFLHLVHVFQMGKFRINFSMTSIQLKYGQFGSNKVENQASIEFLSCFMMIDRGIYQYLTMRGRNVVGNKKSAVKIHKYEKMSGSWLPENQGACEWRSNEMKEFGTNSEPIQTLKFDILVTVPNFRPLRGA